MPIGLFALLFGVLGLIAACLRPRPDLRCAWHGIGASLLAVVVNFAVAFAPAGYHPAAWRPPHLADGPGSADRTAAGADAVVRLSRADGPRAKPMD